MKKAASYALGCKVNQVESEAIAEAFAERGYEIVDINEKADVYVINTCTVTNFGDKKSRQLIRRVKRLNPDSVVVAVGCYAQTAPEEIKKIDIEEMKQIMNQELNNKKVGDKFIVSALLPPEKWSNLNRSQKITLSLYLKNIIENCSDRFRVCDILHNNIKQYERY